jgi:hypothetical protein
MRLPTWLSLLRRYAYGAVPVDGYYRAPTSCDRPARSDSLPQIAPKGAESRGVHGKWVNVRLIGVK